MAKTKTNPTKEYNGVDATEQQAYSDDFKQFFVDELKDVYWAEKHLTKALPKMKKSATSDELAKAFEDHLAVTKTQIGRLEEVFSILGVKAQAKKCDAMEGIVEEGNGIIEETDDDTNLRDVGLIMAGQKVEHYEIATYGALVKLAQVMGNDEIVNLLETTLQEEKDCDELLSSLAEGGINQAAAKDGMDETDSEDDDTDTEEEDDDTEDAKPAVAKKAAAPSKKSAPKAKSKSGK